MKRTIIFGDLHGCYREWQDLLDKIAFTPKDDLISVGDLICKGPCSKQTLDLAMSLPNLRCVMGNHEWYMLRAWKTGDLELLKSYHAETLAQLRPDEDRYFRYLDTWPFYIETPGWTVVHAGIRPGKSLKKQTERDLTHLRALEDGTPWFESYKSSKLIVFGHWARLGLVERPNAVGLDSGCVYGEKLSALILPERKIVSVKARKRYSAGT